MDKNITSLFKDFLTEYEYLRKSSPKTITSIRQTFELFMRINSNITLENLSAETVTDFFVALEKRQRISGNGKIKVGIKKSTVALYWSNLSNFFHWLEMKKHIEQNPFNGLTKPTPSYEDIQYLKKEDVKKISDAIQRHSYSSFMRKRDMAILYVFLFCGLRKEELLMLQIQDIDFKNMMLTVRSETSKAKRARIIPLHHEVGQLLNDYLKERKSYTTPFLFVSSMKDQGLKSDGLRHFVDSLRKISGVHFHLHQFRHTFAVNFLRTSNNIAKLKQLLGHKDIAMTMVYLRCLPPNEMKADIEGMKIGEFL